MRHSVPPISQQDVRSFRSPASIRLLTEMSKRVTNVKARRAPPLLTVIRGPNLVSEMRACARSIASLHRIEGRVLSIGPDQRFNESWCLDEDKPVFVFEDAERLAKETQIQLIGSGAYSFVLLVTQKTPSTLKDENLWVPAFAAHAFPHFRWPSWNERREDHAKLFETIIERLCQTKMFPPPRVHGSVYDFLASAEIEGTEQVERLTEDALTVCLNGKSPTSLTAEHYIGKALRALSPVRQTESSVPPSN